MLLRPPNALASLQDAATATSKAQNALATLLDATRLLDADAATASEAKATERSCNAPDAATAAF